jgi:hypothetical protein
VSGPAHVSARRMAWLDLSVGSAILRYFGSIPQLTHGDDCRVSTPHIPQTPITSIRSRKHLITCRVKSGKLGAGLNGSAIKGGALLPEPAGFADPNRDEPSTQLPLTPDTIHHSSSSPIASSKPAMSTSHKPPHAS